MVRARSREKVCGRVKGILSRQIRYACARCVMCVGAMYVRAGDGMHARGGRRTYARRGGLDARQVRFADAPGTACVHTCTMHVRARVEFRERGGRCKCGEGGVHGHRARYKGSHIWPKLIQWK